MSKKNCQFCNIKFGTNAFKEHIADCICNSQNNKSGYLIEFISHSGILGKEYIMYAIFGTKCKFSHIDEFLKKRWCECCGHLSTLDKIVFLENEMAMTEIKFNILISKHVNVDQFRYQYDMGSTTTIFFRIVKKLDGIETNTNIELLYHNEPYKLKCKCKKEALYIYEGEKLCEECKEDVDEPECALSIVNSPRVGMCGYE